MPQRAFLSACSRSPPAQSSLEKRGSGKKCQGVGDPTKSTTRARSDETIPISHGSCDFEKMLGKLQFANSWDHFKFQGHKVSRFRFNGKFCSGEPPLQLGPRLMPRPCGVIQCPICPLISTSSDLQGSNQQYPWIPPGYLWGWIKISALWDHRLSKEVSWRKLRVTDGFILTSPKIIVFSWHLRRGRVEVE